MNLLRGEKRGVLSLLAHFCGRGHCLPVNFHGLPIGRENVLKSPHAPFIEMQLTKGYYFQTDFQSNILAVLRNAFPNLPLQAYYFKALFFNFHWIVFLGRKWFPQLTIIMSSGCGNGQ